MSLVVRAVMPSIELKNKRLAKKPRKTTYKKELFSIKTKLVTTFFLSTILLLSLTKKVRMNVILDLSSIQFTISNSMLSKLDTSFKRCKKINTTNKDKHHH